MNKMKEHESSSLASLVILTGFLLEYGPNLVFFSSDILSLSSPESRLKILFLLIVVSFPIFLIFFLFRGRFWALLPFVVLVLYNLCASFFGSFGMVNLLGRMLELSGAILFLRKPNLEWFRLKREERQIQSKNTTRSLRIALSVLTTLHFAFVVSIFLFLYFIDPVKSESWKPALMFLTFLLPSIPALVGITLFRDGMSIGLKILIISEFISGALPVAINYLISPLLEPVIPPGAYIGFAIGILLIFIARADKLSKLSRL